MKLARSYYISIIREAQRRRRMEFLRRLRQVHQFELTATTDVGYDDGDEGAHLLDVHISFAVRGEVSAIAYKARVRGLELYRKIHGELYGYKPVPSAVRGKFQRITQVSEPNPETAIQVIEHIYRGKQFYPRRRFTRHIPVEELLS